MSKNLEGKTAVVTGASAGFGVEIARALAKEGARVVITGRTAGPMDDLVNEIQSSGGKAQAVVADLRKAGNLDRIIRKTADEHGLDILINNAGVGANFGVMNTDREAWEAMFETNVLALLEGSKAAVEVMRAANTQGFIVNISSVAALRSDSGVYGSTKHAVNCINETLRKEVQGDGIRVINIMPGAFSTSFARNVDPELVHGMIKSVGIETEFVPGEQIAPEVLDTLHERMKDLLGHPREIAAAVVYALCQPAEVNVSAMVVRPLKDLPL